MTEENNYRLTEVVFSKGILEILKKCENGKPKHFENFRNLLNYKTNKKFSPSTISSRLKQLVELGVLKRTITKTKTGREVVGYIITEEGSRLIKCLNKCKRELNLILKEKEN